MTLTIPGVATVHPREAWVESCFPISGRAEVPGDIVQPVVHYSSALDLPDGDIGEFDYQIPPWLRASNRDYWLTRTNSSPTLICGRLLPGYSLGYLFAIDWLGGAWELRGFDFMPAANAGHNHYTAPLLFITDRPDPATPLAWATARAIWREFRRRSGRLDFRTRPLGHGELRETTGVGTPTACPGAALLAQLHAGLGDIDSEDDDMNPLATPIRAYDSRPGAGEQALVDDELAAANAAVPRRPFAAGEVREIVVGMTNRVHVNVTTLGGAAGFVEVAGAPFNGPVKTSLVRIGETNGGPVATPKGAVYVFASAPCDVIVDVRAR